MIKLLSEKTARYLASDDANADIEVIAYGYYMFYQQWLLAIGILLAALPLGWFLPVLASLTAFMTLRGCLGGTHATHPLICKIATFTMVFIPVVLAEVFAIRLVLVAAAAMYLFSIILVAKYVPGDTDVKKISNPRIRRRMKIQSVIGVSSFLCAAILLRNNFPEISFAMAASVTITCSLVHPWAYRLFGFDPVTKEALRSRW